MKKIAFSVCAFVLACSVNMTRAQQPAKAAAAAPQAPTGRLLVTILSGSEDPYRVGWGLRIALNAFTHPYGEKQLDNVSVILFSRGVTIVDPKTPYFNEFRQRIEALRKAGVEVVACVSGLQELGLEKEAEALGIKAVHASVYVSTRTSEGYTIMTF
jgi:hypothetical protein